MIQVRRASLNDINSLVRFRTALFKEMKLLEGEQQEKSFQKACKDYFYEFIPKQKFLSWIAENDGEIIAVSGVVFFQKPPSPGNNTGKEAYIMNMYTLTEWRKKGIASKLLEEIIGFLKRKGITSISLHTTEVGKSVYEKIGFTLVNTEMKLTIKHNQ
ncbi:MAG: GNAT family N-acetyltransferase [Promethearchaeota archaeon]